MLIGINYRKANETLQIQCVNFGSFPFPGDLAGQTPLPFLVSTSKLLKYTP